MPKDFRKSGKLAKMAERLAGYTSVDQDGGIQGAYSLEGMLSRLPILSRYGEHGVKIYSSDKVDHGDVKIS
jgi:hypothetical protein